MALNIRRAKIRRFSRTHSDSADFQLCTPPRDRNARFGGALWRRVKRRLPGLSGGWGGVLRAGRRPAALFSGAATSSRWVSIWRHFVFSLFLISPLKAWIEPSISEAPNRGSPLHPTLRAICARAARRTPVCFVSLWAPNPHSDPLAEQPSFALRFLRKPLRGLAPFAPNCFGSPNSASRSLFPLGYPGVSVAVGPP